MKTERAEAAIRIARNGGALALDYFRKLDSLAVEAKGHQDFVTVADRNVETLIREEIAKAFPDDGIVGEEHAPKPSRSGYTWVIDPIDGTANFVNSIPAWVVILAVVHDNSVEVGVIHDPVHAETFFAEKGQGARLNDKPLICPADTSIRQGSIATGFSNRGVTGGALRVLEQIIASKGVYYRNASGGVCLAYVAAGRLLGYIEEHMNPWDCLAGQLLIAEAGGQIEAQDTDDMLANGGRVVVGSKGVFDKIQQIADQAFDV